MFLDKFVGIQDSGSQWLPKYRMAAYWSFVMLFAICRVFQTEFVPIERCIWYIAFALTDASLGKIKLIEK